MELLDESVHRTGQSRRMGRLTMNTLETGPQDQEVEPFLHEPDRTTLRLGAMTTPESAVTHSSKPEIGGPITTSAIQQSRTWNPYHFLRHPWRVRTVADLSDVPDPFLPPARGGDVRMTRGVPRQPQPPAP